jgi:hypothetical protein
VLELAPGQEVLQRGDATALLGEHDGRRQHLGEGLAAVVLEGVGQYRRGARHRGRAMPAQLFGALQLARGGAIRRTGRAVQAELATIGLQVQQQHGLPAEAAGGGLDHAEREGGRHRGIDGIAPGGEQLGAGLAGVMMLGRDHAATRHGDPLRMHDPRVARI